MKLARMTILLCEVGCKAPHRILTSYPWRICLSFPLIAFSWHLIFIFLDIICSLAVPAKWLSFLRYLAVRNANEYALAAAGPKKRLLNGVSHSNARKRTRLGKANSQDIPDLPEGFHGSAQAEDGTLPSAVLCSIKAHQASLDGLLKDRNKIHTADHGTISNVQEVDRLHLGSLKSAGRADAAIVEVEDEVEGVGEKAAPKERRGVFCKKYGPWFIWGQLNAWYKQTVYDPTASLSAERRGTISLPDVECTFAGPRSKYSIKVCSLSSP